MLECNTKRIERRKWREGMMCSPCHIDISFSCLLHTQKNLGEKTNHYILCEDEEEELIDSAQLREEVEKELEIRKVVPDVGVTHKWSTHKDCPFNKNILPTLPVASGSVAVTVGGKGCNTLFCLWKQNFKTRVERVRTYVRIIIRVNAYGDVIGTQSLHNVNPSLATKWKPVSRIQNCYAPINSMPAHPPPGHNPVEGGAKIMFY